MIQIHINIEQVKAAIADVNYNNKGVTNRVKTLFKDSDLTKEQFAELLGYTVTSLDAKFYNSRKWNCEDILKVATVFGVSCDFILKGEQLNV